MSYLFEVSDNAFDGIAKSIDACSKGVIKKSVLSEKEHFDGFKEHLLKKFNEAMEHIEEAYNNGDTIIGATITFAHADGGIGKNIIAAHNAAYPLLALGSLEVTRSIDIDLYKKIEEKKGEPLSYPCLPPLDGENSNNIFLNQPHKLWNPSEEIPKMFDGSTFIVPDTFVDDMPIQLRAAIHKEIIDEISPKLSELAVESLKEVLADVKQPLSYMVTVVGAEDSASITGGSVLFAPDVALQSLKSLENTFTSLLKEIQEKDSSNLLSVDGRLNMDTIKKVFDSHIKESLGDEHDKNKSLH